MIDLDRMREIAHSLFVRRVEEIYGPAGSIALRELLIGVHSAHRQLPYELVTDGLVVVSPLEPGRSVVSLSGGEIIAADELSVRFRGAATIEVMHDGRVKFWPELVDDFGRLAETAVVYYYRDADFFFLEGALSPVPNPTGFPSCFGLPTFVDLDRALVHYASSMARYSTCKILRTVWFDASRILLNNKPEKIMRESLAQYLQSTLRDHELVEVREEQNVDESHPVDIKVSWSMSNRVAIIEIKWMGDSAHSREPRVGTWYDHKRALDGADQLARYLDANVVRAPRHITRGYLTVFDGRRDGIVRSKLEQTLSAESARYFADKDVVYDPVYHEVRMDFAPPVRFYLEPREPVLAVDRGLSGRAVRSIRRARSTGRGSRGSS
jgi:hypothetical protein